MSNTAILKPLAMTATPAVSGGSGAANLLTDDPKEVWIAGASGNATITLDLGSAQTIDTAFLGFSNLASGDTVVAATSNASDMTGASTLESRVIPDSLDITHMVFTGSSRSARYLRFTITTSVTPQAGIARAGAKFQPTYNREWGSGRSVIDTGAKEALLGGGFGIGEGARKAAFRWTFGDLSDAEVESLYDIAADRGETRPLIVAEDPDNTAGIGRRIHYGLFDRLEFYERANPSQNRWSLSLQGWGAAPRAPTTAPFYPDFQLAADFRIGKYHQGGAVFTDPTAFTGWSGTTPDLTADGILCDASHNAAITNLAWFNAAQGTFVVIAKLITSAADGRTYLSVTGTGDTQNVIQFANLTGAYDLRSRVSDTSLFTISATGASPAADATVKCAFTYGPSGYRISVNGNTAVSDATATIPTVTRLNIGSTSGANTANARIGLVLYKNTESSAAALALLSA